MASIDEPWRLDAVDLARLIRTGRLSAREALESCLGRLEAVNPGLNAVVLSLADEARDAADAADAARRRGDPLGPLHGVPVTTKVNTDQKGCPSDNGIVAYRDMIAGEDSPVVANLRRAGAIVFGRTNTPGYSMRWFTDNALHGLTRNPWHPGHTAGGSSGGAGSAVAAGIGPIAQGNDIAGSVRYPAYCNGLVGLRPTYGRVPSFNPAAKTPMLISSQLMAVQGPLTRTVRDNRLAFEAMAVPDPRDPRCVPVPFEGPPPRHPVRVALVSDPAGRGVHPAVADAVRSAGRALEEAGYAVEECEPPGLGEAADLWPRIGMDDVIAQLEPLVEANGDDGIRVALGHWRANWPRFDASETLAALGRRLVLLREWELFFEECPIVVMPVSGEPPFPVGLDVEGRDATARIINAQLPLLAVSVLGLPGLSVPTGLHDGLPLGVQIVAGRYREDLCYAAAEVIETHLPMPTPVDPRA